MQTGTCLEELREITNQSVKVVDIPAWVRTEHFPDIGQTRNRLYHLARYTDTAASRTVSDTRYAPFS
jgi:hypothetical protein